MENEDIIEVIQLVKSLFPNSDITFKDDDLVLVAEEKDELIGFIHISWIKNKAVVRGLGVRPDKRGHGVGEMLVEAALSKLLNEHEIHLKVKIDNLPALRLYEKYGFFLKKYGRSLVMVKKKQN